MIEGQSLFQLATRSQAAARHQAFPRKDQQPAIHLSKSMQLDAKMKAFWQEAAKKAAETVTISDETLKRLDTARKSDNKEVAAEKYRQAKAKLQALRLQAQLAAATGDAKTLRRIAQEAALAAREIANSARGLADGIAGTATSTPSPNAPAAATAASNTAADAGEGDAGKTDVGTEAAAKVHADIQAAGNDNAADPAADPVEAFIGPAPADADPKAWGKEALRKLGDDARSAIAQARGIIAFLANAARAARKHQSDPEEEKFFNELQRSVGDAEHDLNSAINSARQTIDAGDGTAGEPGGSSATASGSGTVIAEVTTLNVTVTTVAIQTTELGAGADLLV